MKFLPVPTFRNTVVLCLVEVASVPIVAEPAQAVKYNEKLIMLLLTALEQLSNVRSCLEFDNENFAFFS
jgi:hypothetical protein